MSGSYSYIVPSGVIVSDTGTVLATVQGEWQASLGYDLNVDVSQATPQAIMISAETLARSNVIQNNAAVANQINPNQASGVFLDAICALTGLERFPDTYTTVTGVTLTGSPYSPLAAGILAATAAGDQFALQTAVTLPTSGTYTGAVFVAVVAGPVACGTGSAGITTLVSDELGWETVSTPSTATITIGLSQQADQPLRALRNNSLSLQSFGMLASIISNLWTLPGVIGVRGLENDTSSGATISGISMVANSIWICVDGGSATSIAATIVKYKMAGCPTNGAQTASYYDQISYQTYSVTFDVPTYVPILVQITCKQGTFVGEAISAVTQAVIDYGNNAIQNLTGLVLGQTVSPFEISAAIMNECQGLLVTSVQIALSPSGTYSANSIAMNPNQRATVSSGAISVTLST